MFARGKRLLAALVGLLVPNTGHSVIQQLLNQVLLSAAAGHYRTFASVMEVSVACPFKRYSTSQSRESNFGASLRAFRLDNHADAMACSSIDIVAERKKSI
jgi:hypothetical protein